MKPDSLSVFVSFGDSKCAECGEPLDKGVFLTLRKDRMPICLTCADLDHLIFLPAGDTALTGRAGKYSTLSALVLKWSKARKRNERQGLLVEPRALENAEQECMADSDARARQRESAARRRADLDREYVRRFAEHIRKLFPHCPAGKEKKIAEQACMKYSDRIGRSAIAKNFDENALKLAVVAHIRHAETEYDQLLAQGLERFNARAMVNDAVREVLSKWESDDRNESDHIKLDA